jgi:hypothetical protein
VKESGILASISNRAIYLAGTSDKKRPNTKISLCCLFFAQQKNTCCFRYIKEKRKNNNPTHTCWTMVKPPIVRRTGPVRAQCSRDSNHASSPDSSSENPTFPRRFPRLGKEFQTKMPKTDRLPLAAAPLQLKRPPPDFMSTDYPFISEREVQSNQLETMTAMTMGE